MQSHASSGPENRGFGFSAGRIFGWLAAPLFGAISFARHARTFHPRGPVFLASVTKRSDMDEAFEPIARRLVGPALARFSGALWKHSERIPDVLGCALRFRDSSVDSASPASTDQDLLFATILRPYTMPFAPFTTDVRDYRANDYFAVSPFDAGVGHRVFFRLHPQPRTSTGIGGRRARLARAVEAGGVVFSLDAATGPFGPWRPVVDITLERIALVDGEALRFRPFRAGRALHPRGFVHALRLGVYALSQRARPANARASKSITA